jgi:hypothetical protein
MRRLIIALLVAGVGFSAEAAPKKTGNKPAAAQPTRKKDSENFTGTLTKDTADGKTVYKLKPTAGDALDVSAAAAKKMSINLDDFVGKVIVITGKQDEKTKAISTIMAVKTEADFKKQSGK